MDRYYAVRVGRGAPKIVHTVHEFQAAVYRFSCAAGKRFDTHRGAAEWLAEVYPRFLERHHERRGYSGRSRSRGGWLNEPFREIPIRDFDHTPTPFQQAIQPIPSHIHPEPSIEPTFGDDFIPFPPDEPESFQSSDVEETKAAPPSRTRCDSSPSPPCPLGSFPAPTTETFTPYTSVLLDDPQPASLCNDDIPHWCPILNFLSSEPPMELSPDQHAVLQHVMDGRNVFFTGSAGTGKSFLLGQILDVLSHRYDRSKVAVTATTGMAALNIGGTTLHSFAGLGLGRMSLERAIKRIIHNKYTSERWKNTEALIVDEVSMLEGGFFDLLDQASRHVREDTAHSFGGIQIIMSGDFFQLPPVPQKDKGRPIPPTLAFDADGWHECFGEPLLLWTVFRQKDKAFATLLNNVRLGRMTVDVIQRLRQLSRLPTFTDDILPTVLYPTKGEVGQHNLKRLSELPGEKTTYTAVDSVGVDEDGNHLPIDIVQNSLDQLVALKKVTLKIGAQVMLIKNVLQGRLVNGSVGKVIDIVSIGDIGARKMEFVRVGRRDPSESPGVVWIPEGRQEREGKFVPIDGQTFAWPERWPLVEFTNGMKLLCAPVEFEVQGFTGNVEALRFQVPLIMAWALSIHKSQGQTLQRVRVDLERSFETGMSYVALSRATSMEGLQVLNFHPSKVKVHLRVKGWTLDWMSRYRFPRPPKILKELEPPTRRPTTPEFWPSSQQDETMSQPEEYDGETEFDSFVSDISPNVFADMCQC